MNKKEKMKMLQEIAALEARRPKKLTIEAFRDAPAWANYLTVDEDGSLWWWEKEPIRCGDLWIPSLSGQYDESGDMYDASDWKNSLVKRGMKGKTRGGTTVFTSICNLAEAKIRPWTFEEAPLSLKIRARYLEDVIQIVRLEKRAPDWLYRVNDRESISLKMASESFDTLDGWPCGAVVAAK